MQENAENKKKTSHSSLDKAAEVIRGSRHLYRWLAATPLLLLVAVLAGFTKYRPGWHTDPFLLVIFAMFTCGQVVAFCQYRAFGRKLARADVTVGTLLRAGENPDLTDLSDTLRREVPECAERDLVLRWVELGLKGEHQSSIQLSENAKDRQALAANNAIGIHTVLNRTTLKMGFLGTLIGLVRTFPPMKQAILGLSDSDGEMRFVRDIARAIDGDEYAILTTLVATGLSIVVETLSIHMLERFCGGTEKLHGYLNDWYVCIVLPIVQNKYSAASRQTRLLEGHTQAARKRAEVQALLENHVQEIAGIMKQSYHQIQELNHIQESVNKRMSKLMEFEREYVNYVVARDELPVLCNLPKRISA